MKVGYGRPKTEEEKDLIKILRSREYWDGLSEWSQEFIESIEPLTMLSVKQSEVLHRIYDDYEDDARDYDMPDFD
jgi:hypothetical protein